MGKDDVVVGKIRSEEDALVFGSAEGKQERPFDQEDRVVLGTMLGGDNYSSYGVKKEEESKEAITPSKRANLLAAAITEAIEIWRDRGPPENSAREEVARRFPQFAGLQGMLENTKEVRCALDVGDHEQIDDLAVNASLLNAVDAVRGGYFRWSWECPW